MKMTKEGFALAALAPRESDPPAAGLDTVVRALNGWREHHAARGTITPTEAARAADIQSTLADLCLDVSARVTKEKERLNPDERKPTP